MLQNFKDWRTTGIGLLTIAMMLGLRVAAIHWPAYDAPIDEARDSLISLLGVGFMAGVTSTPPGK